ncbi:MAG: acyl-CoA dehydrogenase [Myxococcales bacterium]|nr:acyl-CoA dehydrogenase [Myxococcales bacterium]MCB9626260.1 acyl-CoA dehydrogenase [Sandaracinaceae bacterium]
MSVVVSNGQPTLTLVLDEEQQMLRSTARQFVDQHAPVGRLRTLRDARDPRGFSDALWKDMAELGWLGLQLPEEHDGVGLGFFDLAVVLEQCGRRLMPEPLVSTLLLGAQALMLGGTSEQQAAWLPGIGAGEKLVALGFDERGARGNPAAGKTRAVRTGSGFTLTGSKVGVLDAHVADLIIVSAHVDGQLGLFLVDPSAPGVSITRHVALDLRNAGTVTLTDVLVGEDAVLGGVSGLDNGGSVLDQVLDRARIGLAAEMLGAMEQAFEDTVNYLKERVQFDRPLGSFQALQHRAARLYTSIALARSAVLAAARTVDQSSDPREVAKFAALAKVRASEAFYDVAREAIQLHGGIGMTDEHDIGFYLKRAQTTLVSFGTNDALRARWAELNGY